MMILALINADNLPKTSDDALARGLTIAFMIIAALAFLMIVISGLRYVFARGEPEKMTVAKNQIFYSIIGLVLAASAAAIVNVVLGRVG